MAYYVALSVLQEQNCEFHSIINRFIEFNKKIKFNWSEQKMPISLLQEDTHLRHEMVRIVKVIGAAVALFLPGMSYAAAFQYSPTVSLEGSYNDNFRLVTSDPDRVFSTVLAGSLGLQRITDTMVLEGTIGLDFVNYFGDTDRLKDEHNQFAAFKLTRKGERFSGKLGFSYRRDTLLRTVRTDRDLDELPVGDGQFIDDGLFTRNIRRNRLDARPSLNYKLTELTGLQLTYRYENTFHDDPGDPNNPSAPEIADFTRHTLDGKVETKITEKNKLLGLLRASRFDSDAGRIFDNYEVQAGVSHDFDETTNLTFTLGGRRTELEEESSAVTEQDNGFVFRLAGKKLTGLTKFNGVLERTVSPSGSGDLVRTDAIAFNMTRDLSELLLFTLRSRIFETESLRTQKTGGNRRSFSIEPLLTWSLAESWALETSYRYRREKRFNAPDSADSNSVLIVLKYQPRKEGG